MPEPAYVTHPEMTAALSDLERRLVDRMAAMEIRLTMRMFTVMLVGNGVTVAILGTLIRMWLGDAS